MPAQLNILFNYSIYSFIYFIGYSLMLSSLSLLALLVWSLVTLNSCNLKAQEVSFGAYLDSYVRFVK